MKKVALSLACVCAALAIIVAVTDEGTIEAETTPTTTSKSITRPSTSGYMGYSVKQDAD